MKPIEFAVTTGLAGLSLVAAIALVVIASDNRSIERGLQDQQQPIQQGQFYEQARNVIVRDLAALSVNNTKIRDLLSRHGFNVTVNN